MKMTHGEKVLWAVVFDRRRREVVKEMARDGKGMLDSRSMDAQIEKSFTEGVEVAHLVVSELRVARGKMVAFRGEDDDAVQMLSDVLGVD